MKFKHTPITAARCIRVLLLDRIATTWAEYHDGRHDANAWTAAKLVQEQVNGAQKNEPCDYRTAAEAVQAVMPELYADYWEKLPQENP